MVKISKCTWRACSCKTKSDIYIQWMKMDVWTLECYSALQVAMAEQGIPENVAAGSQLKEIVIEAVDEDGQVDNTMEGPAHALTLDWNPSIAIPLQQGRCILPLIEFPCTPGVLWKRCVAHTKSRTANTHYGAARRT